MVPDETDQTPFSASPYSTGGGGTRLEHRVGTFFLVRLLTGGSVLSLGERPPARVAFQQSASSTVDDLIVTADCEEGTTSVRLDVAVRRAPKFVKSHAPTQELVLALVRADLDAERSADSSVDRRLGVAVSGQQTHTQELAELATTARGQSNAEDFVALIRSPGKFAYRRRFEHLLAMVGAALEVLGDEAAGAAAHRCWSLLSRLWVMQVDLEAGHEDAWTALIDSLKPVAIGGTHESAVALRQALEELSAEGAKHAYALDGRTLRQRIHGKFEPDAPLRHPGWGQLVALDRQARSVVERSLTAGSATGVTLQREQLRGTVHDALAGKADVLVRGDSGVGKSAMVLDATEASELGGDCQAFALHLRHLPREPVLLPSLFSGPLEGVLAEVTAPERMLVVDGAEAAAEGHREMFTHILDGARRAGFRVVVVSATEGAEGVAQLMKVGGHEVHDCEIDGLTAEDLDEATLHFPALRRLVDDPRARELLRRPIIIDLLTRAAEPGMPLSESEALEHVWRQLIRNGDRLDEGAPDAREQVVLGLAAHQVGKSNVDDLLARFDDAAVAGLRRSGVLMAAGRMPWERLPTFKHDLLRAYSVARLLLAERDPVSAIRKIGAPRWTLPSARLACEIVLAAPEEARHPRAARFSNLQSGFEAIAAEGGGARWADVPSEALVATSESSDLLKAAWPTLVADEGSGLERLIRVIHQRHQPDGFIDPVVAEPLVEHVLANDAALPTSDDVTDLLRDWLRAHVIRDTPAGLPARIQLGNSIVRRSEQKLRALDQEQAVRAAKLAARTAEEVAADDARDERLKARHHGIPGRRRRATPSRHRPYLWISDAEIEHLALLGPDLGRRGEEFLRRIAEDEPHSLDHAVESLLAGRSLASYDPTLLLDLTAAYYIDNHAGEGRWSSGLLEDGIRHHRPHGFAMPMISYLHGPFVAMFQSNYRGGVALLNRMLDHAARCRVRALRDRHDGASGSEPSDDEALVLSISGEPRQYVGDSHVWLWYRGTGVGPYPCMSALQALEFVTERHINAGVPPQTLAAIMLEGATTLAMPALVLGILVRHLETGRDALERFLVEPDVWELEFSRAVQEYGGGLASRTPELSHPERRGWNLREVGMMLALRAEGDQIERLKALGAQLERNARERVERAIELSAGTREHLAAVKGWASSLDRSTYEITTEDGQLVVQQAPDPVVEEVLGAANADLRRNSEALGLASRHAHVRKGGRRAPAITAEDLLADLASAKDLLENPPQALSFSTDGPVAVAATAVELHLTSRSDVPAAQLEWSARTLLEVARQVSDAGESPLDDAFYERGADRSAARALPYLLLPAAEDLRASIEATSGGGSDGCLELHHALAVGGEAEVRLAYARGLDAVWEEPCDSAHSFGRCHHEIALGLATESFAACVLGPWNQTSQQRGIVELKPPVETSLGDAPGSDLYVQRLTPALRATGSAAASTACCADKARRTLDALLAAHQRAMLVHEEGYHHSQSDTLVAARAALRQAIAGRDEVMLDFVRRYIPNPRLLADGLQAVAAAAEEGPELGSHAQRLWPRVMDVVLDAAETDPRLFGEHTWGPYAEAALIPNPAADWAYLTAERSDDSSVWWSLSSWAPQIDRWVGLIEPGRSSIDHLVIAVRSLDLGGQAHQGLHWVERVVAKAGQKCRLTYVLPEWLREIRPRLVADEDLARWQRVLDHLVVAGDSRVADLAD